MIELERQIQSLDNGRKRDAGTGREWKSSDQKTPRRRRLGGNQRKEVQETSLLSVRGENPKRKQLPFGNVVTERVDYSPLIVQSAAEICVDTKNRTQCSKGGDESVILLDL
jgi:hypothetical protein